MDKYNDSKSLLDISMKLYIQFDNKVNTVESVYIKFSQVLISIIFASISASGFILSKFTEIEFSSILIIILLILTIIICFISIRILDNTAKLIIHFAKKRDLIGSIIFEFYPEENRQELEAQYKYNSRNYWIKNVFYIFIVITVLIIVTFLIFYL